MDRIIKMYDFEKDNNLHLCHADGVAYQVDHKKLKTYDNRYFNYCLEKYSDTIKRDQIDTYRTNLVNGFIPYADKKVLDIGVGSGSFITKRNETAGEITTHGYDVDTQAVEWLHKNDLFANKNEDYKGYCMWDVLEHIPEPERYFRKMKKDSFLFVSIPIFADLKNIRKSKHYLPNEHLYYFTDQGLVDYLKQYNFRFLKSEIKEQEIGRKGIWTCVFKKDGIDYNGLVQEYKDLHSKEFYGSSSSDYLEQIAPIIINRNPRSILDYGCGRSDLLSYFFNDGRRKLHKYDPAIPNYKTKPEAPVDLVLCTDVLEHIRLADLDRVLSEIREISNNVIFSLSCIPARKKLLNGMNAHVTVQKIKWWQKLILKKFGCCKIIWKHKEEKLFICKTF